MKFNAGDLVEKVGGDYSFSGTVVAAFKKLNGLDRYVVEDDRGILHVYSEKNLKASGEKYSPWKCACGAINFKGEECFGCKKSRELFNSIMPDRLHIGSIPYEKIKCTCGMDDRVACEVHPNGGGKA